MPDTPVTSRLRSAWARRLRRDAIRDLTDCDLPAVELAHLLGTSKRTIERTLAKFRATEPRKRKAQARLGAE